MDVTEGSLFFCIILWLCGSKDVSEPSPQKFEFHKGKIKMLDFVMVFSLIAGVIVNLAV